MRRWIAVVLGSLISMGIHTLARGGEHSTDPLELVRSLVEEKKAVLIDVREESEWDRGHIEGALFLPLSTLIEWERDGPKSSELATLKRLIRTARVYCHCASGGRTVTASESLRKLGLDARALRQGYRELLSAGFKKADN